MAPECTKARRHEVDDSVGRGRDWVLSYVAVATGCSFFLSGRSGTPPETRQNPTNPADGGGGSARGILRGQQSVASSRSSVFSRQWSAEARAKHERSSAGRCSGYVSMHSWRKSREEMRQVENAKGHPAKKVEVRAGGRRRLVEE